MADQADVFIKNGMRGDINVRRKLSTDRYDLDVTFGEGEQESIKLPDTDVSLVIQEPNGKDLKNCKFQVDSDVDLVILYSRSESYWEIKVQPNDLLQDMPTTVNVNIGEDEPE